MREAVIVGAARTPVGRIRGCLAPVPAWQLGVAAVKEAVKRSGINPADVDEVMYGNLLNADSANMAREVALGAGLPVEVPGITMDRQCAASLNTYAYASILIEAGYADCIITGGVESDSRRNYVMDKPTTPFQVVPPQWTIPRTAPPEFGDFDMVDTADNIAKKFNISREDCDDFAALSHRKSTAAYAEGRFTEQLIPIEVPGRKGAVTVVDKDECFRPDCTPETLSKLRTVKPGEGNVTTAGNSSPMSDGAGAVIVMERKKAEAMGLKIWATFKAYTSVGVDPLIMGTGPIAATRKLFKNYNMNWNDIDIIEMNEAFAAQSVCCIRELDIPMDKLNPNGGAISLGHPLAGTGSILITKMIYELERADKTTGLITFCCGGGQGVSVVIERV